jgi:hypothetical protein
MPTSLLSWNPENQTGGHVTAKWPSGIAWSREFFLRSPAGIDRTAAKEALDDLLESKASRQPVECVDGGGSP